MKIARFLLALLLFAFLVRIIYAQNFKGKPQELVIAPAQEQPRIGEKLNYSMEWLGIPVMEASLRVTEITNIGGRECYHLQAEAHPNAFFRVFYDVGHKMDSYVDTKSLLPVRFERKRCEKNKCTGFAIEFNHDKNEAKVIAYRNSIIKIPPNTQDLLSALYYFRLLKIREGQTYSANILYGEKNLPISVTVKKPFLMDIRKKGAFFVIEITPSEDLVEHLLSKRMAKAYFSSDSARKPLLFIFSTRLGILRGALQNLQD